MHPFAPSTSNPSSTTRPLPTPLHPDIPLSSLRGYTPSLPRPLHSTSQHYSDPPLLPRPPFLTTRPLVPKPLSHIDSPPHFSSASHLPPQSHHHQHPVHLNILPAPHIDSTSPTDLYTSHHVPISQHQQPSYHNLPHSRTHSTHPYPPPDPTCPNHIYQSPHPVHQPLYPPFANTHPAVHAANVYQPAPHPQEQAFNNPNIPDISSSSNTNIHADPQHLDPAPSVPSASYHPYNAYPQHLPSAHYSDPTAAFSVATAAASRVPDMSAPAVSHVADLVDPATSHLVDVVAASHDNRVHPNSTAAPMLGRDSHAQNVAAVASNDVENVAKLHYAAQDLQPVKSQETASGPRAQGEGAVQTVVPKPAAAPLASLVCGERDILNRNMVSSRSSTNVDVRVPKQIIATEQSRPQAVGETTSKPEMLRNVDERAVVSPPAPPSTTPSLRASDEHCSRVVQRRDTSMSSKRRKRGRERARGATATPMTRKRRKNVQLLSHVQIGDEVSVYWADDKQYYDGVINERMEDGKFRIVYFDDDVEILDLADSKETWCFRGTAAERVKNASSR